MTAPVTSLKMSAAQFNQACVALGLSSQGEAAAFLDLSIRTVHGYANGTDIPAVVAKLLRLMIKHKAKPENVR